MEHFDPRQHPRNRLGQFRDLLGKLEARGGGPVKFPDGTRVHVRPGREHIILAGKGQVSPFGGRPRQTEGELGAAATRALNFSAHSDHPDSLGGAQRYESATAYDAAQGAVKSAAPAIPRPVQSEADAIRASLERQDKMSREVGGIPGADSPGRGKYVPKGRTDESSYDYTDDPQLLSGQFTPEQLQIALDDADAQPNPAARQWAQLKFDYEEELPRQAVEEALALAKGRQRHGPYGPGLGRRAWSPGRQPPIPSKRDDQEAEIQRLGLNPQLYNTGAERRAAIKELRRLHALSPDELQAEADATTHVHGVGEVKKNALADHVLATKGASSPGRAPAVLEHSGQSWDLTLEQAKKIGENDPDGKKAIRKLLRTRRAERKAVIDELKGKAGGDPAAVQQLATKQQQLERTIAEAEERLKTGVLTRDGHQIKVGDKLLLGGDAMDPTPLSRAVPDTLVRALTGDGSIVYFRKPPITYAQERGLEPDNREFKARAETARYSAYKYRAPMLRDQLEEEKGGLTFYEDNYPEDQGHAEDSRSRIAELQHEMRFLAPGDLPPDERGAASPGRVRDARPGDTVRLPDGGAGLVTHRDDDGKLRAATSAGSVIVPDNAQPIMRGGMFDETGRLAASPGRIEGQDGSVITWFRNDRLSAAGQSGDRETWTIIHKHGALVNTETAGGETEASARAQALAGAASPGRGNSLERLSDDALLELFRNPNAPQDVRDRAQAIYQKRTTGRLFPEGQVDRDADARFERLIDRHGWTP